MHNKLEMPDILSRSRCRHIENDGGIKPVLMHNSLVVSKLLGTLLPQEATQTHPNSSFCSQISGAQITTFLMRATWFLKADRRTLLKGREHEALGNITEALLPVVDSGPYFSSKFDQWCLDTSGNGRRHELNVFF